MTRVDHSLSNWALKMQLKSTEEAFSPLSKEFYEEKTPCEDFNKKIPMTVIYSIVYIGAVISGVFTHLVQV